MKNKLLLFCVFCISLTQISAQNKVISDPEKQVTPDVYIDNKKYDHDIIELLDVSKIKSLDVIKGEEALKKYNAPNGVILIKSKKEEEQIVTIDEAEIKITDTDNGPMIIKDGEIHEKSALNKLSPEQIESINVVKGQKAIDDYNAPNGVIIIKTKKK